MLIGSFRVSEDKLRTIRTADKFIEYAKSLVPEEYNLNKQIVDNQVYYNLLVYYRIKFIDNRKKRDLSREVYSKIYIKGYIDSLIALEDVL